MDKALVQWSVKKGQSKLRQMDEALKSSWDEADRFYKEATQLRKKLADKEAAEIDREILKEWGEGLGTGVAVGLKGAYYIVVIATCGRFMGWW